MTTEYRTLEPNVFTPVDATFITNNPNLPFNWLIPGIDDILMNLEIWQIGLVILAFIMLNFINRLRDRIKQHEQWKSQAAPEIVAKYAAENTPAACVKKVIAFFREYKFGAAFKRVVMVVGGTICAAIIMYFFAGTAGAFWAAASALGMLYQATKKKEVTD
jgi:hypothetical protein